MFYGTVETTVISLNGVNQLISLAEKKYVLCETKTTFSDIIYMNLRREQTE